MQHASTQARRVFPLLAGAIGGVVAVVAMGVAAAWYSGWLPQSASARPLALVVCGDTAGWIMPCGCSAKQSGGLARRAAFVKQCRRESDVIVADVGGAPSGAAPYDRFKFAAILRGEVLMGVQAHNLGAAEAALGAAELRKIAGETGARFVSANVRDEAGELVAAPLVELAIGGRRGAILGVLAPRFAASGLKIGDPAPSVLEALKSAKQKFDWIVVLAYLPTEELTALAGELPEVDVVIGGPTRQSIEPQLVGPTLLAAVTSKGKFAARLNAPRRGEKAWSGSIVEIDDAFAEDEEQLANLEQFHKDLAKRDFTPSDTSFVPLRSEQLPASYRVAGVERCRDCHTADCQAWDETRHAKAWQTLVDRGVQADSYCQQCHTTGFGLPGGFVSAGTSAAQTSVACESCHGPSVEHAARPQTKTPFAAREQCARCHDRENNPGFAYDVAWPTIEHGRKLPAAKVGRTSEQLEVIP